MREELEGAKPRHTTRRSKCHPSDLTNVRCTAAILVIINADSHLVKVPKSK